MYYFLFFIFLKESDTNSDIRQRKLAFVSKLPSTAFKTELKTFLFRQYFKFWSIYSAVVPFCRSAVFANVYHLADLLVACKFI